MLHERLNTENVVPEETPEGMELIIGEGDTCELVNPADFGITEMGSRVHPSLGCAPTCLSSEGNAYYDESTGEWLKR